MATITSNIVRAASQLDFSALGFAETPDPNTTPDPLDKELARAIAYVEMVTGRDHDVEPELADGTSDAVLFEHAVQLRVEQQIIHRQAGFVADQNENAIDIDVTGYAQKRIASKEQAPRDMVNFWPDLNELLIFLMTEEKRAYWEALGKVVVLSTGAYEHVQQINWGDPSKEF